MREGSKALVRTRAESTEVPGGIWYRSLVMGDDFGARLRRKSFEHKSSWKFSAIWSVTNFLKWGSKAFDKFPLVVPTGTRHLPPRADPPQNCLWYIAKASLVVESNAERHRWSLPEPAVGNRQPHDDEQRSRRARLGVAWMRREAAMLGQAVSDADPYEVVGLKLNRSWLEGITGPIWC